MKLIFYSCLQMRTMMFILATSIELNLVFGLIGYDCGQKFTNFTTFSLVNVGECDLPEPIDNDTKTEISLLQINEYADTLVRCCIWSRLI